MYPPTYDALSGSLTYAAVADETLTHLCCSLSRALSLSASLSLSILGGPGLVVLSDLLALSPFLIMHLALILSSSIGSCPLGDTACACGSIIRGLISVSSVVSVSLFPVSLPREACNPDIASPTRCQLLLSVADSPFPPVYCLT